MLLGRRIATIDNATAIRPFGTIDAPTQGQTVSGTILNRGWALTPAGKAIPFDGSTIKVYIDGLLLAPVSAYNRPRPDVKAFFPGLANADGPEGSLSIDTTLLADGVHTIAWGVTDDAGVTEGIGSRYFTVQNGGASLVRRAGRHRAQRRCRSRGWRGCRPRCGRAQAWTIRDGRLRVETDAQGKRTLRVAEGQRVELFLDPTLAAPCGTYTGHMLDGDVAGPLPAGASLDAQLRDLPLAARAGFPRRLPPRVRAARLRQQRAADPVDGTHRGRAMTSSSAIADRADSSPIV